jgi:hypothetical protein
MVLGFAHHGLEELARSLSQLAAIFDGVDPLLAHSGDASHLLLAQSELGAFGAQP